MTRGWLALEPGGSQFVSKDRCCRPEKFGKCIDRQIEWSVFGESSIGWQSRCHTTDQHIGRVEACVVADLCEI